MVNTFLNLFICPLIGRTVDRIGERRALLITFTSLALVFTGFALSEALPFPDPSPDLPDQEMSRGKGAPGSLVPPASLAGPRFPPRVWFLFALCVLDNLLAPFSLALSVYLNKIALPEDLRPTLSMGVTMDHIVAVIMPVISGFLWNRLGYQQVFLFCTLVTCIAWEVSRRMPPSVRPREKRALP